MAKGKKKKKDKDEVSASEGEGGGGAGASGAPKAATGSGRVSWQLEAIDANRAGDPARLIAAFRREGADVNTQSANGGWGGFRYTAWGKSYGGTPDGNSMLHIAVAEHNKCYPNRFEIARALIAIGIDVALRNAEDQTARDLNMALVDAVYPIAAWRVVDVLAWLQSKGTEQRVRHLEKWMKVFEKYRTTGQALEHLMERAKFDEWVTRKMPDLTRIGFPSSDLNYDTERWAYVLELLRREMKKGYKLRITEEAHLEVRMRKAAEAEERAAADALATTTSAPATASPPPPAGTLPALGGDTGDKTPNLPHTDEDGDVVLPSINSSRPGTGSTSKPNSRPNSRPGTCGSRSENG